MDSESFIKLIIKDKEIQFPVPGISCRNGMQYKTRAHQEGESIFIPVMDPQKRKTSLVNVPFVMD
jgi:hypothetical protein